MRTRLWGLAIVAVVTPAALLITFLAVIPRGEGSAPAPAPVGVTTMPTPDPAWYR